MPNETIELVTKKINLNAAQLSWEHERFIIPIYSVIFRFNIRRLPAVTISRYSSFDEPLRNSLLDTPSQISIDNMERNIRLVFV